MFNSNFFSLQKKLLILVLSATMISILITTILFLNFDDFIYGSIDGAVTTFAIVAGVVGAYSKLNLRIMKVLFSTS